MNERERIKRNSSRLSELYPPFAKVVFQVISDVEAAGYRPRIQEAYRSPKEQLEAYRSGNSRLRFGFHNVTNRDGRPEALAVDLYDDDRPLNPTTAYFLRLSALAWHYGLATGILWGLSEVQKRAITAAIQDRDWSRPVRVGWDAWHIEPKGLTASQARQGTRPKLTVAPTPFSEPAARPYSVVFPGGQIVNARMQRDQAWLPVRLWGGMTGLSIGWQGDGFPILIDGQPYFGEMQVVGNQTFSSVRDLAAFSGHELVVDVQAKEILVRERATSPVTLNASEQLTAGQAASPWIDGCYEQGAGI